MDEWYDELRISVARLSRQLKKCEMELAALESQETLVACRISMREAELNDAKERLRKAKAAYRKWQRQVKRMRENVSLWVCTVTIIPYIAIAYSRCSGRRVLSRPRGIAI